MTREELYYRAILATLPGTSTSVLADALLGCIDPSNVDDVLDQLPSGIESRLASHFAREPLEWWVQSANDQLGHTSGPIGGRMQRDAAIRLLFDALHRRDALQGGRPSSE